MKTYLEKNFNINCLKNIDIQQVGVYYRANYEDIKKQHKNLFDKEEDVLVDMATIEEMFENGAEYNYEYTDNEEIEDFINMILKTYNHYLVVAYNNTWDNRTGYKITDNKIACFYRDYDVTQYINGATKNGKVLSIREYSHDVPMGHLVHIIGITDREYNVLENADFTSIMEFAEKTTKNIIEL